MARESKESIHERILAAAEQRFWRFGIKKTSIDEIAADAEIGKGTVYLHFDSKEEIAIAIIGEYKREILARQEQVALDRSVPVLERLKRVLILPIENACRRFRESPMMVETVITVKPQTHSRFRELMDREASVIAGLITEANQAGQMHVEEPLRVARLIKNTTFQYMPTATTWSAVADPADEISSLVDLLYVGLR